MKKTLLEILHDEVKPALGCTGPISVAFATAEARRIIGGTPKSIKIIVDMNTYKNSIAVVTPGTPFRGVLEPACVGAFYGNAEKGMEVLKDMISPDEDFIRKFAIENAEVDIKWDYHGMGLYIDAVIETELGIGHAIVAKEHDRVVLREKNGEIIYKDETFKLEDDSFDSRLPIRDYSVKEIYDFANNVPINEIEFLNTAIEMNMKLSNAGMNEDMGSNFGKAISKLPGEKVYIKAKSLAAAASDARMAGKNLPAMSCAKSGNVGIAASLPLIPVAESLGCSRDKLIRAICVSYLMTIYLKSHIGRLSAMCACAIAASIGVGTGCCLLMGMKINDVSRVIHNIIGSIGGTVCDGAKFGCALKLSSAAGIAIESSRIVENDCYIANGDGLICYDVDETIAMLGRIAAPGMVSANEYMSNEIIKRENSINK